MSILEELINRLNIFMLSQIIAFEMVLDENTVIKIFRKRFKGIYEDVGIYRLDDKYLLFNIDTFVGSSDRPYSMSMHSVGYKSIVSVASDLAVKGVMPFSLNISIGFETLSRQEIEDLRDGILYALNKYDLSEDIIHKWDTNYSRDLFISVAAYGLAGKTPPLRSGVKVGDKICIDGGFGLEALGLYFLLGKDSRIQKIPRDVREKAIESFLYPEPRLYEYIDLINNFEVHASIDSSDGLARSLNILSRESNVKIIVEPEKTVHNLVVTCKKYLGIRRMYKLVYYGGEEYRGIFAVTEEEAREIEKKKKFICIGYVERGQGVYIKKDDKIVLLKDLGFIHKFS